MRRVCNLTVGLLFLGAVLAAGDAFAQTGKDFVGTWTLVSAVTEQGGNMTGTFGSNQKGILMVVAKGGYVIAFSSCVLSMVSYKSLTKARWELYIAMVGG